MISLLSCRLFFPTSSVSRRRGGDGAFLRVSRTHRRIQTLASYAYWRIHKKTDDNGSRTMDGVHVCLRRSLSDRQTANGLPCSQHPTDTTTLHKRRERGPTNQHPPKPFAPSDTPPSEQPWGLAGDPLPLRQGSGITRRLTAI